VRTVGIQEINARIGRRLALRREAIGLSLSELAQRCGVSAVEVEAYETGELAMSAALLQLVAEALHTSAAYFYEDGPAPFRPMLGLAIVPSERA
jgi:transcriptional regulator with XRE-family HTH domain